MFVLPSGGKRMLKKMNKRVWYDDSRVDTLEQFPCFRDVRVALRSFHIAQHRNYAFRRSTSDRVVVDCIEEGCPFYLSASKIKHDILSTLGRSPVPHATTFLMERTPRLSLTS
jgi:hypothetical protein